MIARALRVVAALTVAVLGPACIADSKTNDVGDLDRLPRAIGDGGQAGCASTGYGVQAFNVHDCWGFGAQVGEVYYFGGRHHEDRSQGVIVIYGDGEPRDRDPWYETRDREGDVTIYYATLELICFTTAEPGSPEPHAMHVSADDPTKRRFFSATEARRRCPPLGPVSKEESKKLPGEYERWVEPNE